MPSHAVVATNLSRTALATALVLAVAGSSRTSRAETPAEPDGTVQLVPERWHETGFHIAFGLGPSSALERPGLASQFRVGATLRPDFRLFYYALGTFYKVPRSDSSSRTPGKWRSVSTSAVGMDWFFHPRLAARVVLGYGANSSVRDSDANAAGFSYGAGLSLEMLQGEHRLSIDPMLLMTSYKQENLCDYDCAGWTTATSMALTLNYAYH
jgi:hypothetical protein